MGGPPRSRPDQRHYPRIPLEAEVHYHSDQLTLAEQTRDISLGGLFIASEALDAVGTTAEIKLRLPSSTEEFVCQAEICWSSLDWELAGSPIPRPVGMGLRYVAGYEALRSELLREYGSQLLPSAEIDQGV